MDGCSLAISSGASPIVTHGNYKKLADPTKASQGRTLAEITAHHTVTHGSDVARTLLKNQYVASVADKTAGLNNLVTVVGFRDTVANTWSFYWQRRRVNADATYVGMILQDRSLAADRVQPVRDVATIPVTCAARRSRSGASKHSHD